MIDTQDKLTAALVSAQRFVIQKASITGVENFYYTLWGAAGTPAAGTLTIGNTTTGVIPTDATLGAPVINAFNASAQGALLTFDASSSSAGELSMYDRLFHVGSILVTSLATTTLSGQPALTRVPGNDYSQVEMWLEVNVAISATATTVTVSYQDGNNVTQTATLDTNISGLPTQRMMPFRLANSTGVQKINSITVGGTVGTAGSFNVVLQRNIQDHGVPAANIGRPKKGPFDCGLMRVYEDSCLALMYLCTTTSTGTIWGEFQIGNG